MPESLIISRFLSAAQVRAVFALTALNVHAAETEAFGMTIVEAAVQGVPSIVHHDSSLVPFAFGAMLPASSSSSFASPLLSSSATPPPAACIAALNAANDNNRAGDEHRGECVLSGGSGGSSVNYDDVGVLSVHDDDSMADFPLIGAVDLLVARGVFRRRRPAAASTTTSTTLACMSSSALLTNLCTPNVDAMVARVATLLRLVDVHGVDCLRSFGQLAQRRALHWTQRSSADALYRMLQSIMY
jgi:hypothetical protein